MKPHRARPDLILRRLAGLSLLGLALSLVVAVVAPTGVDACAPARVEGPRWSLSTPARILDRAGVGLPTCGVVARQAAPAAASVALTPYEVVGAYPHDPDAFLQGLVWHDGGFYASTGLNGRSSLRRVEFPSGEVVRRATLAREYFGEGLALVGDRLIQLTWTTKKGFVYDRETFALLGEFAYETEGWGITYDGTSLIMSDGSDVLTFLDPETFQPTGRLAVTLDGRPLRMLNELEWIEGEVWANVWQTDSIVRIDPATGRVVGMLDLTGLLPAEARTGREDVLNGIAYDAATGRIFVGGKLWPLLFEIRRA